MHLGGGRQVASAARTTRRLPVHAFTLIEVMVVVAIMAVLASLLLASLSIAREQGKRAVCASLEHEIVVGLKTYATSERGQYPYGIQFPFTPFGPTGREDADAAQLGSVQWYGRWRNEHNGIEDQRKQKVVGYPGFLALYKLRHVDDPKAFYCPSQEYIRYDNRFGWGTEPTTLVSMNADNPPDVNWPHFYYGYSLFANYWMGKNWDRYGKGDSWLPHYPDNWGTHAMYGAVALKSDDPKANDQLLVTDIMQDWRSRREVLRQLGATGLSGIENLRPTVNFNTHGGRSKFVGGNVSYNDGSSRWRSRLQIEGDFLKDWQWLQANPGHSALLELRHIIVTRQSTQSLEEDVPPGLEAVHYNIYW